MQWDYHKPHTSVSMVTQSILSTTLFNNLVYM